MHFINLSAFQGNTKLFRKIDKLTNTAVNHILNAPGVVLKDNSLPPFVFIVVCIRRTSGVVMRILGSINTIIHVINDRFMVVLTLLMLATI